MKVSVILPVYNAESTLRRSLTSLEAQTFKDFELLLVDDCSTDGSAALMETFAATCDLNCKLLRTETNSGAAAARNVAVDTACGEYLAFIDADDAFVPEALETAVAAADTARADIVGWDWNLGLEKNSRLMHQREWSSPLEALKNLMSGTMRWNLWLFMVRRSLVEDNAVAFIPGADMGEDMQFIIKSFACAVTAVQLKNPLYKYNAANESSISRHFSSKRRAEVSLNIEEIENFIQKSDYSEVLQRYITFLKLNIKLPLLVTGRREDYELWRSWMPEVSGAVCANRSLPLYTRLLQRCAAAGLWPAIKAYYILVYKFVYGIIYK